MRVGAHALVLQQVGPYAGAPLPRLPAPRVIDQDLAHGPRRHGEEVAAVARRRRLALRHLEVGLVHEVGRAQAAAAAPELQVGDPAAALAPSRAADRSWVIAPVGGISCTCRDSTPLGLF